MVMVIVYFECDFVLVKVRCAVFVAMSEYDIDFGILLCM